MVVFVRGNIAPEAKNPVNRALIFLYRPIIARVLKAKTATILLAFLAIVATIVPARELGGGFMPTLDEGALLYMPTTPASPSPRPPSCCRCRTASSYSFPRSRPPKRQVEAVLKRVPGTASAYAERVNGGHFLDIVPDHPALARYNLMIGDVQEVIATALGGETITTTVEGRERYGVNIRYPREFRSDPQTIAKEVLTPLPRGGAVPPGEVARIELTCGPTSIRTENGHLAVYVFVDVRDRDLGSYVAEAQKAVAQSVSFPAGSYVTWSGQFEYMQRAEARLKIVVPLTLAIIFLLLYLNFRRLTETLIVMASLPFALVGGVWAMWLMGFDLSVAAAVGFIALAGVAAETGVVMLIYLDQALKEIAAERAAQGRAFTRADLHDAIMLGAVERVRPKMMTVTAIIAGLLPILWSQGAGSEVMQRIAAPMIGGMASSTVLTLVVIPAIYALVKGFRLPRAGVTSNAGRAARRPARK
jgi:Cu(I)/Ag(I) efflux system membrane protein CusA/SilA